MCIPVHFPWLPGYTGVVQTVLIILIVAGLRPDRPQYVKYTIINMYIEYKYIKDLYIIILCYIILHHIFYICVCYMYTYVYMYLYFSIGHRKLFFRQSAWSYWEPCDCQVIDFTCGPSQIALIELITNNSLKHHCIMWIITSGTQYYN